MERVVLPVELRRSIESGTVCRELDVPGYRNAVFEADRRAFVEAEQISRLCSQVAQSKIAVEPVCQSEVRLVPRERQRCREIDEREVGLERAQHRIVILLHSVR